MWPLVAILATALVGLALGSRMHRRGQPAFACMAAAALCLCSLGPGPSDGVLTGALCVGAVLAAPPAMRQRLLAVAVAVGLTVAVADGAGPDTVAMLAVLPTAALWWASPRRTPDDVFALFALMFLVAGLFAPAVLALLAWEGLTRRGLPIGSALLLASYYVLEQAGEPVELAAIPVGMWVTVRLFVPSLPWRRRAWPLPVPRAAVDH